MADQDDEDSLVAAGLGIKKTKTPLPQPSPESPEMIQPLSEYAQGIKSKLVNSMASQPSSAGQEPIAMPEDQEVDGPTTMDKMRSMAQSLGNALSPGKIQQNYGGSYGDVNNKKFGY